MNRPSHLRARLAVLATGGALIAALFPMAGVALAASSITSATGGGAISADTAGTATFTTLTGPSIVGVGAGDIAEIMVWVATRPPHVNIDEMIVKPVDQADVGKVFRRPQDPAKS